MVARTSTLEETVATLNEQKSADKNALKAMQEIVDALTEQKLHMTVHVQELQDKCNATNSRCENLDIENESLQRQLKRITDENDDLITDVNTMEQKLLAVNSLGEEQQKQFLQLEESTNKLLVVEGKYEEAKKTIDMLEEDRRHMQTKMKAYKGKIIEIVAKFKRLRASHKATLEIVQDYSSCIPNWQEELRKITEVIAQNQRKDKVEVELEKKDEIDATEQLKISELTESVDDLRRQLESSRKIISQVEAEKLGIIDEKSHFENQSRDLENKLLARKQENSDLLQEMKVLNETMKERGETISRQQSEQSQLKQTSDALKEDLKKIQSILTERDQTICALIEEQKMREPSDDAASTSSFVKMDESMTSVKENTDVNDERYAKLKAMAVKLKKRLDEELKKVKVLEEAQSTNTTAEKLEESLKEALDREKAAKQEADKFKGFAKKYNMLALEMESYEKSMEVQTEKLEQKQRIIRELEQTIEEQQRTIGSIKEEMRAVDERSTSEVNQNQGLNDQISKLTASVRELQQQTKDNQVELERNVEEISSLKVELENTNNELDRTRKESQNKQESASLEREKIQSTCSDLEVQLRNVTKKLSEKEEDFDRVSKEYSGYKLRAQNILQQSQTQVNSREKELEEELETVKRLMKTAEQNYSVTQERMKEMDKNQQVMVEEKERSANRYAETLMTMESLQQLNAQLKLEGKQHLEEQQEAVKSHRLNMDTLTGVFRAQIEELEGKLRDQEKIIHDLATMNRKLEGIAKRSSTDEEKIVEMRLNFERQMLDDNSSARALNYPNQQKVIRKVSSNAGLMPLEDLLNSNLDEEDYDESSMGNAANAEDEKILQAKETQIKHLSSLLSEAEQDVAKLNQQNDLLKEEIRRQERSEERDAHIHNSEYLKNVIFKVQQRGSCNSTLLLINISSSFQFMTTKEEKVHLVPVLTTMLKLSPAETQKLQAAAKGNLAGDSPRSGWTNYLPFK